MKQIRINTASPYMVSIGSGLLKELDRQIAELTKAEKVCIVSDDQVWPLYGQAVCDSLKAFQTCVFQFSAGESSKNIETYGRLLHFLAENEITRSDCILALGGGVVGDLAGFAAATYLRGIAYVQVPTTLLAMVDSSVGGKTGIDLPMGKNLCGAFYQPVAVICDTDTLSTLPADIFQDGCAEVIKYAVLFDPELFAELEHCGLAFDRESVIARCVTHKQNVVAEDEHDTGKRMLLNLGHTIGHAIEKGSDYAIPHGQAVAIGMAIVSRGTSCADTGRIVSLLEHFGLPTSTGLSADTLYRLALSDKKRSGGTLQLIVPQAIGQCTLVRTPMQQLKTLLEEGL